MQSLITVKPWLRIHGELLHSNMPYTMRTIEPLNHFGHHLLCQLNAVATVPL